MNINTNYNINNNNRKQQSFGSAVDVVTQGLRFLNTNEAIGATIVDFTSMAMPRTIVDSKRGFDAGVETGIRESSGTLNHLAIGAIGGLAAFALSGHFNKEYGVLSHAIFANNDTIDILGKIWHKNYPNLKNDTKALQEAFYRETLSGLSGLNSADGQTAKWVKIDENTVDKITKTLTELTQDKALRGKRIPKDKYNYLRNLIISATGAEKEFKLVSTDGKVVSFSITSFLDDLFAMGKTFSTEKVAKAFEEAGSDFGANVFIKRLKGMKLKSAMVALGISSAIGASVQPINRWLTKRRTGSDGFVGVANNPNAKHKASEKTSSFIMAKAIAAAGMLGISLASITTNFKELAGKLQFKGKIPTLNQFKLVYGITIASRFLAARSGDELREASFKDILGFLNWLVLGGFVAKGVVTAMDKTLLNSQAQISGKGLMNWLRNKSVKTVDEVLQGDLLKRGVKTVTEDGKAVPFKTLLNKARELGMTDTLKKVRILNIAQVAGYLYSGILLGVLIPKLNIKMTEMKNRKQSEADKNIKAEEIRTAENKAQPTVPAQKLTGAFAQFIN